MLWAGARLVFLLAALVLANGCATGHRDRRSFPLGIYSVPSPADFAELHQAGFNLVVGPASKEYLDSAHSAGLKVLAHPPNLPASRPAEFRALDSHPALWAWYLIDEPDLNLVSPTEVRRRKRTLERVGARKPIALTLYQGYEAFDYGDITDIVMVDRYPVPWLPLANFGQHIKMGRLAVGRDKPLIAIVQAFDWKAYPGMLATKAELRAPTPEELRCMVYEALARGANGLFFFEFDGGWKLREHPELWEGLKGIVSEVRAREPLFLGQRLWWAKEHGFSDPALAFNAALESSVTSTLLNVKRGNETVPAGRYVVAVNNTPNELEYSFALPLSASETDLNTLPVLGEGRGVQVTRARVKDLFEPYAVHVYGPLAPAAKTKAR